MGCNFPLKGWQSAQRTESGKRGFTTDRASALVDLPMEVPCGQCIGCRVDKAQEWATRLEAERTFHRDARFLTVTYSDEHLPEGCTLVPADLKRFIERLRHWADVHLDGQKLRFYGCGEYGDDPMVALDGFPLGRPHYHIIVYGIAFPDEKVAEQSAAGEKQFSSKILDDLWGKGRTRVGLVTRDSCGYVAGYATKKITGDIAVSHYQQFDLRTGSFIPSNLSSRGCLGVPVLGAVSSKSINRTCIQRITLFSVVSLARCRATSTRFWSNPGLRCWRV